MKFPTLASLLLLAALTAGLPVHGATTPPPIVELDRIVAIVNDNVVTLDELNGRLATIKHRLQGENTPLPSDDVLRRQVLERLIIERLELDRAKQLGVQVDDEAVTAAISKVAEQNKLSLDQFRQTLESQGVDFAAFRKSIRNEMIIGRLQAKAVDSRVTVSPHEIDQYLSQHQSGQSDRVEYRLAHILVAVPAAPTPEQVQAAQAKADKLMKQLAAGADFRELAIAQSDGQQALDGGDLGWRSGDQLPTLFADVVPDMKPGDVRGPIRSASGFHIIRLMATRGDSRHVVQQTHARHILIRTDALTSDDEARARLSRLRERILAGEDFAKLARSNSQDPGSGAKGGDLGWTDPGSFVPAFEEVMNKLKPGEISQPFKTQFGWHIVQVIGRRNFDDTDTYRRNMAYQALHQRKADEALQNWVRELRDEAYVKIMLDS